MNDYRSPDEREDERQEYSGAEYRTELDEVPKIDGLFCDDCGNTLESNGDCAQCDEPDGDIDSDSGRTHDEIHGYTPGSNPGRW